MKLIIQRKEVFNIAKLNDAWLHAFQYGFQTEEDVVEFIFENLDTSKFQDSYVDMGGCNEPNEMFKYTAEDKRETLYNFMIELIQKGQIC